MSKLADCILEKVMDEKTKKTWEARTSIRGGNNDNLKNPKDHEEIQTAANYIEDKKIAAKLFVRHHSKGNNPVAFNGPTPKPKPKPKSVKEAFESIIEIMTEAAHGGKRVKMKPEDLQKMKPSDRKAYIAMMKKKALESEKKAAATNAANAARKNNPKVKKAPEPAHIEEPANHYEKLRASGLNMGIYRANVGRLAADHQDKVQGHLVKNPGDVTKFNRDPARTIRDILNKKEKRDPRKVPSLGGGKFGNL